MIVRLDTDSAAVLDADDCTRLHVATALAPADVDAALRASGIGRLGVDGEAQLDVPELRSRARSAASADGWDEKWTAMISYATAKGWVSSDGNNVTAHIERD